MEHVVTRFAPSPTGFMHIGSVRTALFAFLWARKNKGTFILRIEDTDKEREVAGSVAHIQESLSWLNLTWDYGPQMSTPFGSCIQSERLPTYHAAARELIAKGYAYPDPYSAEEIDGFRRAAQANKEVFLFRKHRPKTFSEWDGKRPLRFLVPEIKRYEWHDEVRGDLSAGEEALDDFILIKGDGYPTYNFAHIIDDMHMGVTHVMRGDEFISSTPKFLSLYDALGIKRPKLVTLPPILREDKTKKLGKRDGAKDLLEYRKEGFLPAAMINFLAFIGWHPGSDRELFTLPELIEAFDISTIQTHGGSANEEKLLWFQHQHVKHLSDSEYKAAVMQSVFSGKEPENEERWNTILPLVRERAALSSTFTAEIDAGEYAYFFTAPEIDITLLPNKNSTLEVCRTHLKKILEILSSSDFSSVDSIKSAAWDYASQEGRGDVLWPLRYSLSGKKQSPDPFTIAHVLGKEETLARITGALNQIHA